ncbi:hypothetical protein [Paenibacillus sp. Mc5Re-14]|uniref:hypothetical protein n=1 Tax=Paenibacillus sp. Mc5Re-14 TaxID=1030529 RepID=UPI000A7BF9B2|nr:hypothetical protein [Paenibacillus sp. Mc5Re-14]
MNVKVDTIKMMAGICTLFNLSVVEAKSIVDKAIDEINNNSEIIPYAKKITMRLSKEKGIPIVNADVFVNNVANKLEINV